MNQTGELKAPLWLTSKKANSSSKASAEEASAKYGLTVEAFTGKVKNYTPEAKTAYTDGERVAVTTYNSLFNVNPFFEDPDIIIVDDPLNASEAASKTSRERVRTPDGEPFDVITALAPPPHPRFSRFFAQIKHNLGFGIYVPDCDTTACSISAATQANSSDPIIDQPLIDFYRAYQVRAGGNAPLVSVPLNDEVDYDGGIVTWIDSLAGERPFGNDLDPTLNLDVLEVSFRNCARWRIVETPSRLETVRRIVDFQRRLVASGAFADPKSHVYYLPELYCAYFGRCYAAFRALDETARYAIDSDGVFEAIRQRVLAYVQDELIGKEMNVFDAALALIALGHLGGNPAQFAPALHCILSRLGEGGGRSPFKAYEWNKMKTPTRILVGGPEVTSAFVLMGLALARKALLQPVHQA